MKRTLLLFFVAFFAIAAGAVPALKVRKAITLADGTTVMATLAGDEHYSWYVTDEGKIYAYNDQHVLCESTLDRVEEVACARMNAFNAQLPRKASTTGSHRGLVILAQFSDQKFTLSDPKSTFSEELNTVGYNQNSQSGSVHDYFLAQSNSLFNVTFDVVGPVTLDHTESYYGAPSGSAHDTNPWGMAYDAISKAKSAGYITSSNVGNYDWDSDGYVDMVYIVYAGYAQSNGASENTIWPHESSLTSTITVGSKKFSTYGCNSELTGTSGTTPTGIGTFVHEFSHCMGLRDAYDKSGAGLYGMGRFSPMAYGCYCGTNSGTPCNYTGFERWQSGWATPVELSSPTSVSGMKSITQYGDCYMIKNPGNSDEFYMLENRQVDGWDKNIYSSSTHGLLIYHIDHTSLFNQGPNYTSDHPCYFVVPADASATSLYKEYGMLFPQGSYYKNFPSTTSGATDRMTTYYVNTDGTYYMHKPLTNIAEVNGLIAFDFDGGSSSGGGGESGTVTESKIDRTGWTIKAYSELETASGNEGPAAYAIDNSTSTFYHSDWKGTTPTGKGMPQAFLIDMGSEHNISAWDYLGRNDDQPKGQPTSYRVYIYSYGATSMPALDGKATIGASKLSTSSLGTATKTGTWTWTSAKQVNKDSLDSPVKGRYLLLVADDVTVQSDGQKWMCCADFNIYEKTSGSEIQGEDFTISAYTGTVKNHYWTSTYNQLYCVFLDNNVSAIEGVNGDCLLLNTKNTSNSYSVSHDISVSTNYAITSYSIYYKQYGTDEAGLSSSDGKHTVSINSSNASGVFTVNDFTPASTVTFKATNTVGEYKRLQVEKIVIKICDKSILPTGIDDISVTSNPSPLTSNPSTSVYNLNGQRVTTPQRGGLYIIGGKKVVY